MAIKRADIYEHQNPNLPIVDASNVAGGFMAINSINDRNNIPIAKRRSLVGVIGVGLFFYQGIDYEDVNWTNTSNWVNITALLDLKANKTGDNTISFKVAEGGQSDEAVTLGQLTSAIAGIQSNLEIQGNWNAATNTPDITAATNTGNYWIVTVDGSTNIGGITDWSKDDWVVKTATGWAKIDNTDKVISVAGKTGNIVLNYSDITDFNTGVENVVSGVYAKLSDLFSKNYNDLNNKPDLSVYALASQLFSGNYQDLSNLPDLSNLLNGTDESLYIDTDGILRQKIVSFKDTYYINKANKILPLPFEPVDVVQVFKKGSLLDKSDYLFQNQHDLEILCNVNSGDKIDVYIDHFVDAVYNDDRDNYTEGVPTNIISCEDSMDVVFLVDYTSSMGGAIDTVKTNMLTILNTIEVESNNNFRVCVILFDEVPDGIPTNYETTSTYTALPSSQKRKIDGTDNNDIHLVNYIAFSSDKTAITTEINKLNTADFPLGNGVGGPEPSDIGISEVIENNFAGTLRTSANKNIILFTDSSASGLDDANSSLDTDELNRLKSILINKGIVFSVMFNSATTNTDYQSMATDTQGKYVSNFGNVNEITTAIEEICSEI